MTTSEPDLSRLRLALRVFGALFVVGLWPLTMLWPSGWRGTPASRCSRTTCR